MFDDKPFRLEKQTINDTENIKQTNKKHKICDNYDDLENNEVSNFIKTKITKETNILLEKLNTVRSDLTEITEDAENL